MFLHGDMHVSISQLQGVKDPARGISYQPWPLHFFGGSHHVTGRGHY